MQVPRTAKEDRHKLIVSAITRRNVGSQHELIDLLAAAGCRVTQATVSRDIRELGLEKGRDALGRPRYAVPDGGRRNDPRETLAGLLAQFGLGVTAAQNLVVVRSEIGTAPAIGRALDRVEHPLVTGTLAGDDTCLVIAQDAADAEALAAELDALIG